MELAASGRSAALAHPRRLAARLDPAAIAAWTLAFAVVAYLALSNGGYDTIVRSEVGVAVWWIVLLGALAGVLPRSIPRVGWVAIGLLAAFALWTGLATGWSESAERSTIELGRVAAYLSVLVLAIALQGRTAARHTINGLACAIGLVTVLAVLSRLHPQWFPANDHREFLDAIAARKLSYPLNYWNALAAFAAMGVPLLLGVALGARTLAGQAVAGATLPLSALCLYLTISRGGAIALVVGICVFLAFVPRRADAIATLVVAGLGSAILLSAASQRDALQDGAASAAALHQGTELLGMAMIVCLGVLLVQVGLSLVARHVARPARLAPDRRTTLLRTLVLVEVVVVAAIFAGAPGYASDRWQEFKAPTTSVVAGGADNVFSRLQGVNGNGRYQYWQAALDADASAPWKGTGPGTFEFWWARHGTTPGFVRDAHSLYFETLAETGIPGFALIAVLLALLLGVAAVRAVRGPPGMRIWIAAAVGGLAAFMTSAAFEWVWEMGAIACAVMVLGAIIVAGREAPEVDDEVPGQATRSRQLLPRAGLGLLAALAIGAIAVPLAAALATDDSRDAASEGRLSVALQDSRTAQRVQPHAATPRLQQALVLEQAGALSDATVAARAAVAQEPTNWRTWFTLARIDAKIGNTDVAVNELRKARRLNPRSPLLGAR